MCRAAATGRGWQYLNVPPARTDACMNTTGRSGRNMILAVRMPQRSNTAPHRPARQVAVASLQQAVKAVAEETGREQGQQPYSVGGAGHRTEHRVQALCLRRAGQHRGLEYEETDQHENDGARDAAQRAQRPREQGQRPGHARRGEPLPEVEPNRAAAHLHAGRHDNDPDQDQEQPTPSRSQQDRGHVRVLPLLRLAVCFGAVPARRRAVLRQKAEYSKNPHDDTAR